MLEKTRIARYFGERMKVYRIHKFCISLKNAIKREKLHKNIKGFCIWDSPRVSVYSDNDPNPNPDPNLNPYHNTNPSMCEIVTRDKHILQFLQVQNVDDDDRF